LLKSLTLELKVYVPWPKGLLVVGKKGIMFISIGEKKQRVSIPRLETVQPFVYAVMYSWLDSRARY